MVTGSGAGPSTANSSNSAVNIIPFNSHLSTVHFQQRHGVRLNVSVTKSAAPKAAEGQPQSKICRNFRSTGPREASWTAAVLLPLLSRRLSATDSFDHTQRHVAACSYEVV